MPSAFKELLPDKTQIQLTIMSQLPVLSTRSLSQQMLALRMAKKHKEKEAKTYKNIYEYLTKGCWP